MSKTSTISARIDPGTKESAEQVFKQLGLTASQAIMLFYRQVELQRGLPFPVELPNETTRQALEEAAQPSHLPRFETVEALFEDLGV